MNYYVAHHFKLGKIVSLVNSDFTVALRIADAILYLDK